MGSVRTTGRSRGGRPVVPLWVLVLAGGVLAAFTTVGAVFSQRSPAYAWKPGSVTVYDLTYQSSAAARPGALFNGARRDAALGDQTLAYAFADRLTVTVLSSTATRELVALQFGRPRVRLLHNGVEDAAGEDRLAGDIGVSVDLSLSPRGKIESLRFPADTSPVDSAMLRAVVALIQAVTGPAGTHAWSVVEGDPDGGHRADYAVEPLQTAFSPTIVFKENTLSLPAPPARPNRRFLRPYVKADGHFDGRFSSAGYLASLHGTLVTTSTLSGQELSASKSVVSLVEVLRSTLSPRQLAKLVRRASRRAARVKAIGFVQHRSHAAVERQTYASTLGPDDLDVLVRALAKAQDRGHQYLFGTLEPKFQALFFLDPAAIVSLEPVALGASTGSATFRVLVSALGGAGTPQAQAALRQLIRSRRNDRQAESSLIGNLTAAARPEARTIALLESVASGPLTREAPSTALLSLGIAAQRLSASDTRRAAAVVRGLIDRLAATRSPQGRLVVLEALGNAGLPEAKPAIFAYRTDPNDDIRAAAIYSLRWLHGNGVDAALRSAVTSDASGNVRAAAVSAFSYHRIRAGDFSALVHAARHDPSSQVRIPAVDAIWSVRSRFPDAYRVVQAVAQRDPKETVRRAAQQMLQMDGS